MAPATDIPIKDLGEVELRANVQGGGYYSVALFYGSDVVNVVGVDSMDSMLDIGSVWNKAEFNVFGDVGGSQAQFNSSSSIKVALSFFDGSAASCSIAGPTGQMRGKPPHLSLCASCAQSARRLIDAVRGSIAPQIRWSASP